MVTPLLHLPWLHDAQEYLVRVKDESVNVCGTHKDRRSADIVRDAIRDRIDRLVIITAGNGGFSLAQHAQNTRLRVSTLIDQSKSERIVDTLQNAGADVVRVNLNKKLLTSQKIIRLGRESSEERVRDVSNSYSSAYMSIIDELAAQTPEPPTIVAPIGSGELFMGLHKGIEKHHWKTTLIGVGTQELKSLADKLPTIKTANINNIIQMTRKRHDRFFIRLPEDDIQWANEHAPQSLQAEPSAKVVFGAFLHMKELLQDAVFINTGKGVL